MLNSKQLYGRIKESYAMKVCCKNRIYDRAKYSLKIIKLIAKIKWFHVEGQEFYLTVGKQSAI